MVRVTLSLTPRLLSWWLCMSALSTLVFSQSSLSAETEPSEFIICRQCGTDIADSHYIHYRPSPSSKVQKNGTLFGKSNVHIQILVNPIGVQFTIINTSKGLCSGIGDWVATDSWFPGYYWKFCVCPHCSTHLGWVFEPIASATPDRTKPSEEGFYAIIFDNVLGEKYINSLMVNTLFTSN